jgi:hypothetical protein
MYGSACAALDRGGENTGAFCLRLNEYAIQGLKGNKYSNLRDRFNDAEIVCLLQCFSFEVLLINGWCLTISATR